MKRLSEENKERLRRLSSNDFTDDRQHEPMVTGPAQALLVFDVLFFANYAIGWTLTYIFNKKKIDDNNVTKLYHVWNICIGVDVYPARPVAAVIFAIAFPFFIVSCALHWVKHYYGAAERKKKHHRLPTCVVATWLLLSGLLGATFTLTYAVAPEGPQNTLIHVGSFATGLLGYILLKAYVVMEFFVYVRRRFGTWQKVVYLVSLILQILFMTNMSLFLISDLVDRRRRHSIKDTINGPPPRHEDIHHDTMGAILVFLAAVGPPIQWYFAPVNLLYTAHVVDVMEGDTGDASDGWLSTEERGVKNTPLMSSLPSTA